MGPPGPRWIPTPEINAEAAVVVVGVGVVVGVVVVGVVVAVVVDVVVGSLYRNFAPVFVLILSTVKLPVLVGGWLEYETLPKLSTIL